RIMINTGAVQPDQGGSERMNLVVNAAQQVPGWRPVPELIDGREPVISNLRREISEVLNAAAAIRHGAVHLQIERCVRGLHVIEMGIGKDAIPERSFRFQTQAADDFEVRIEKIEHLAVYQGVVVIAQERLANGFYQHFYVES